MGNIGRQLAMVSLEGGGVDCLLVESLNLRVIPSFVYTNQLFDLRMCSKAEISNCCFLI